MDINVLKAQLGAKDLIIMKIKQDNQDLLDENKRMNVIVGVLRNELHAGVAVPNTKAGVQEEPTSLGMQVDEEEIANVLNTATYGIVEESLEEVPRGRPCVFATSWSTLTTIRGLAGNRGLIVIPTTSAYS